MTPADWTITPLGAALGARVEGVDLRSLSDEAWATVDALFSEYLVLAFPDQSLTPAQHVAIGEHFGDPFLHPFLTAIPEHPAILEVLKEEHEIGTFGGEHWHCDISFQSPPAAVSLLLGHEIPPVGGDTLFANQFLAYETLSPQLQDLLEGLQAEHCYPNMAAAPTTAARHPLVRVHPVSGRKAIFVNSAFVSKIDGLADDESDMLLAMLEKHQTRAEFITRVGWSPGQVLIWDNRATLHYAMNDYPGHRRRLQRVTAMERP